MVVATCHKVRDARPSDDDPSPEEIRLIQDEYLPPGVDDEFLRGLLDRARAGDDSGRDAFTLSFLKMAEVSAGKRSGY